MVDKIYTTEEAAEVLRMSRDTLDEIRKAGEIQYLRLGKRKIGYTESDLKKFVDSRRRWDQPEPPVSQGRRRTTGRSTSRGVVVRDLWDTKK